MCTVLAWMHNGVSSTIQFCVQITFSLEWVDIEYYGYIDSNNCFLIPTSRQMGKEKLSPILSFSDEFVVSKAHHLYGIVSFPFVDFANSSEDEDSNEDGDICLN